MCTLQITKELGNDVYYSLHDCITRNALLTVEKKCCFGSLIELWPCQPAHFLLFDGIMHLSGAGLGEIGLRLGPGAGPMPGNCNPRKFSEKIALHNLRQAEDTAAFRDVMMDITSIRVSLTQFKTRLARLRQLSYI